MTQRYFFSQLPPAGGLVGLPEAESRHAAQVMRVQPGDRIELFDGQNRTAAAVVQSVARREVRCDAEPPQWDDREPVRRIVAAVAIPKGDRSRLLVEKLTELGVAQLVPLVCQRSQWDPSAAALEKLRRAVIEACKQCGRNQLMQITPPLTAADSWPQLGLSADGARPTPDTAPGADDDSGAERVPGADDAPLAATLRWIAHPSDASLAVPQAASQAAAGIVYAVGPEGGFTQQETAAAAQAGWQAVELGPRIYRIETAAMVLAVWAGGGR